MGGQSQSVGGDGEARDSGCVGGQVSQPNSGMWVPGVDPLGRRGSESCKQGSNNRSKGALPMDVRGDQHTQF